MSIFHPLEVEVDEVVDRGNGTQFQVGDNLVHEVLKIHHRFVPALTVEYNNICD